MSDDADEREQESIKTYLGKADSDKYTKVCSTPMLRKINQHSVEMDYNRCLQQDVLDEELDPVGLHIISPIMIHEHRNGVVVDPHLRAWVYMKIKDQEEPERVILDMEMGAYDKLTSVEQFKVMAAAGAKNVYISDVENLFPKEGWHAGERDQGGDQLRGDG